MLEKNIEIKDLVKEKRILLNVWRIFFFSCVFLFLLHLCRNTTLHFDGAMNNEVAYNLAIGNGYATSYHELVEFDQVIQTGAPVLLPVALLNVLFGINYKYMQLVILGYLFAFVLLIYLYVKKYVNERWASVVVVLLLCCPHVTENAYAGYGEICMAVWMLLSLMAFLKAIKIQKARFFLLTGFFVGLGYLTKTVFLICAPAYLYLVMEEVLCDKKIKQWIINCGQVLIGIIIPVGAFETWKLASLGVEEYVAWWTSQGSIIYRQTGVNQVVSATSSAVTQGLFDKICLGLEAYSGFYSIPIPFLILAYLIPILIWGLSIWKKIKIPRSLKWLIVVTEIYFVWYIAIMPSKKLWARRVVVGHCFMIIALVVMVYMLLKYLKEKKYINEGMWRICGIIAVLLMGGSLAPSIEQTQEMLVEYENAEEDIFQLTEFVETLPADADYYAYGWWRNSHVITENGVNMYNITEVTEIPEESFLIVQYPQLEGEPESMEYITTKTSAVLLFETDTCYVYYIRPMTLQWE